MNPSMPPSVVNFISRFDSLAIKLLNIHTSERERESSLQRYGILIHYNFCLINFVCRICTWKCRQIHLKLYTYLLKIVIECFEDFCCTSIIAICVHFAHASWPEKIAKKEEFWTILIYEYILTLRIVPFKDYFALNLVAFYSKFSRKSHYRSPQGYL